MPAETRSGGQRPGQREGTRSHSKIGSSSTNYKEIDKALGSRPKFDPAVETQVYSKAKVVTNGVTEYRCAASGKNLPKDQTSIDHIVNWETYCADYCEKYDGLNKDGSLKRAKVIEGYNDIDNLRVVSISANSSKGNRRVSPKNVLG
ncbi:hypothetical protein [Chlorogloea sp. CCALA 695]|uniref:hypothetical protein n=1 Tax=Chlorogloea sp. CCALA 695 TaxID=2107693 RepID=UPI000D06F9E1|nr:hypothetical protein [Chlorogloea sp. CCALA 695]PSB29995.1 hypothetical protein C7B70_17310 [Chlorogloea sp. CCALA 695]